MELNKIEFKPNYSVMNVSTKDLEVALNRTLQHLDGYHSSKIKLVNQTGLKAQIAFRKNTTSIIKNKVAAIVKLEDTFNLTPETKEELNIFLKKNIDVEIFEMRDKLVVELDAGQVIYNLLLKNDDNKVRTIGAMFDIGSIAMMQIYEFDKEQVDAMKNQNKFANKVNNYNNKYYNKNQNQRQYNHNNNQNRHKQYNNK